MLTLNQTKERKKMKVLLIDNYDSFTYLLVQYFQELEVEIEVITEKDSLAKMMFIAPSKAIQSFDAIIISPGPKTPKEATFSREVVRLYAGKLPLLGICLGLQVIADLYGGKVERGAYPAHGVISTLNHNTKGIFESLPQNFRVARYHSLIVRIPPKDFKIDAWSEDGVIQAIHHTGLKLWGIQFHPESLMSEYGHKLLNNFLKKV